MRTALVLAVASPLVLLLVEALARPFAPALSESVHALVSPLCHQDPARTPWAFGHSLGACHRCIGVHLGMTLVAIGWGARRFGDARAFPIWLGLGGIDWLLCQTGLSIDHPVERIAAGLALGMGIALAVVFASRWVAGPARAVRTKLRMRRWPA